MKQSAAVVPVQRDFSITSKTSKTDIGNAIQAAKDFYLNDPSLPKPKRAVLEACFTYADQYLHSVWGRDKSRYGVYSNIVNFCAHFDTVHFLQFAKQELEKLDEGEFINMVLPMVNTQLRFALLPTVRRQENTFLALGFGAVGVGMGFMRVGGFVAGIIIAMLMVVGYLLSREWTYRRLHDSLEGKMANLLGHTTDHTESLEDGAADFSRRLEHLSHRVYTYGMRIFDRVLPALSAEQPRVVVLNDAQTAAIAQAASAPPHYEIGVSEKEAQQAFPPAEKRLEKEPEKEQEKEPEKTVAKRPGKVALLN